MAKVELKKPIVDEISENIKDAASVVVVSGAAVVVVAAGAAVVVSAGLFPLEQPARMSTAARAAVKAYFFMLVLLYCFS